jgi:UDP-N-acetylglucosamine 2-epimerase
MLKVMTIVGTRPEIIRLCRAIEKFDRNFEHSLLHTGPKAEWLQKAHVPAALGSERFDLLARLGMG